MIKYVKDKNNLHHRSVERLPRRHSKSDKKRYECNPFEFFSWNSLEKIESATGAALEAGLVHPGDLVVITAGNLEYVEGSTNMILVKQL
jgi:long-subunit acyl-CoA synthetase (AMP-forming)